MNWMNLMLDNDKLLQLLAKREPLLEEYRPYLTDERFGRILNHPLLIVPVMDIDKCALLHAQLEHKKAAVAKAQRERHFDIYIWLHERPYRLMAMERWLASKRAGNAVYWRMLAAIWSDSENIWQNHEAWKRLWLSDRNLRASNVMTPLEREKLKAMPKSFSIWRGTSLPEAAIADGLSWTFERGRAKWFATRYRSDYSVPRLHRATVKREDVLALLLGRDENEIVTMCPQGVEEVEL